MFINNIDIIPISYKLPAIGAYAGADGANGGGDLRFYHLYLYKKDGYYPINIKHELTCKVTVL